MNNKKRKTNCLNCEHSYRDESRTLRCHKGIMTSVTNYDCESYTVFLEDKEDLYKMYKVVENLKTSHNSDFTKSCPNCIHKPICRIIHLIHKGNHCDEWMGKTS